MVTEMVNRFSKYTDLVEVDKLGNVTATFIGQDEKEPTILVFAHMDELGLMITKVQEDGFLRFDRIGGVPEKTLRGQIVNIHPTNGGDFVTGFVGTHAHHLTPSDKKMVVPPTSEMYIDLGLDSKEKVLATE